MKKLLFVLLVLVLVGCSSEKSRTEVIDTLIDSGYSKNAAGAYQKIDDDIILRVMYYSDSAGYSESAFRYFENGPVLIIDRGNVNMNYHFNEDLMYVPSKCLLENGNEGSTEIVYRFATSEFIITHDDCDYKADDETVNEFYMNASNRKQQALEVIENLGLTVEDLNNLKVD